MASADKPMPQHKPIAGFWRRLSAFVVDLLLLGLAGWVLGFFFYDHLARLGGWGRAIGFTIAVAYFGLMNSRIHGGQTFGKMAMKIRVVSRSGEPLGVAAAFLRAVIVCVPYFLNNAPLNVELIHSWLLVVLSLLIFGVGLSIVYLFVFNRRTRQSLHDLAVGSYVVSTAAVPAEYAASTTWRGHYAAVGVLMALALAAPIATGQLKDSEPFASLLTLQRALANEPGIRHANVTVGVSSMATIRSGKQTTSHLSVSVTVDPGILDPQALANKVARIALSTFSEADQKDVLSVSVVTGFDIGIASAWRSRHFAHSPAQWRERLQSKAPGSTL